MSEQHARLAPSSAHIWVECPGSVAMQERQPPEEETDESREGTAAHWLLCQTLRKIDVPDGAVADNGVPINDEMREAIQEIVTDVFDTLKDCKGGDYFQNEARVLAHAMIHPDNDGTPDVHFVQRSRKTVHLWDFKYGHRFVDVMRCWQLVNYAAGVIETEKIADWRDWTFTFTIAQPRCYVRDELGGPLREWFTTGHELAPLFDRLAEAAGAASQPNAPCKTGAHCLDCKAAWDCEANQRMGGACLDLIHAQQPLGMSNASIGLEAKVLADAMARVKARLEILEVKALAAIDRGENVPWHKLDWTQPRLGWIKEKQAEAAQFVEMFGVTVLPGVALPTPSQCIKQGVDEAVIKPYTFKPHASKKLVRVAENTATKVLGNR